VVPLRDLVSTLLDLSGLLLLVAAAAIAASRVDPALGLAVAGAGMLGVSWARGAADRIKARRRTRARRRAGRTS